MRETEGGLQDQACGTVGVGDLGADAIHLLWH